SSHHRRRLDWHLCGGFQWQDRSVPAELSNVRAQKHDSVCDQSERGISARCLCHREHRIHAATGGPGTIGRYKFLGNLHLWGEEPFISWLYSHLGSGRCEWQWALGWRRRQEYDRKLLPVSIARRYLCDFAVFRKWQGRSSTDLAGCW